MQLQGLPIISSSSQEDLTGPREVPQSPSMRLHFSQVSNCWLPKICGSHRLTRIASMVMSRECLLDTTKGYLTQEPTDVTIFTAQRFAPKIWCASFPIYLLTQIKLTTQCAIKSVGATVAATIVGNWCPSYVRKAVKELYDKNALTVQFYAMQFILYDTPFNDALMNIRSIPSSKRVRVIGEDVEGQPEAKRKK